MQTFLPYPSFKESVACLDYKRLRNQRNEALVIARTLLDCYPSGGWHSHAVTRMWRGYEGSLIRYGLACVDELKNRYCNTRHASPSPFMRIRHLVTHEGDPPWLGDETMHRRYKALLMHKDPHWYGQYNWGIDPNEPIEVPYPSGRLLVTSP